MLIGKLSLKEVHCFVQGGEGTHLSPIAPCCQQHPDVEKHSMVPAWEGAAPIPILPMRQGFPCLKAGSMFLKVPAALVHPDPIAYIGMFATRMQSTL